MDNKSELLKRYFAQHSNMSSAQAAQDTGASVALAKKVAKQVGYHFKRKESNKKIRVFKPDYFEIKAAREKKIHDEFLRQVENKLGAFAHWSGMVEKNFAKQNVVQKRNKVQSQAA